jgi:hypothetical protein
MTWPSIASIAGRAAGGRELSSAQQAAAPGPDCPDRRPNRPKAAHELPLESE